MNAVTKIEAPTTDQTAWIDRGRALVTERRDIDWRLADWMAEGKEAGHLCQTRFDFLADNLGLAPKRLKDALKAATAFPAALRDTSLSIEHHAAVASLPRDEALTILKRASTERRQVNEVREDVTQWRYEHGDLFDDDDKDSTLCTHIIRAWNRATPDARENFMELARTVNFGVIDEDEVQHAED